MADKLFTTVERTIVDWFEANKFYIEDRNGEWFFTSDYFEFSVTEMATAVSQAVAITSQPRESQE